MILRFVPNTGLRACWSWVRAGLLAVAEKTGERWTPEDVYLFLMGKSAFLYALESGGRDVGFAVLQQESDPDGPVLSLWILWSEPGAVRADEGEFYAALEGVARTIHAKRIRMQSPRTAYQRERYWTQVAIAYEHELS